MHRIVRSRAMKGIAFAIVFSGAAVQLTRNQSVRAQALPVPTFYKYEIIARSGAGGLTGFGDNASINDAGRVAFVGQIAGGEGVFIGDAAAAATNITPGFLRTFGRAVQINNTNQVVARDRINGAPPPTRVRIWNGNALNAFTTIASGGGNILDDYDSVFTHASANNGGQVVFSALDGAATKLATPAQFIGFNELTFTGNAIFRPQIADDGSVVIRAGDLTRPILQYNNALTAPIGIGTTGNFSALGMSPGVSDDGRIVAFSGTSTNVTASTPSLGSGIFASVCTSRQLPRGRRAAPAAGCLDGWKPERDTRSAVGNLRGQQRKRHVGRR